MLVLSKIWVLFHLFVMIQNNIYLHSSNYVSTKVINKRIIRANYFYRKSISRNTAHISPKILFTYNLLS